jgi:hypothetical protein
MELKAIKDRFSGLGYQPYVGSTKSLTGHAVGAAGVHEAIYSLLMLNKDFLAESANIENVRDRAWKHPCDLQLAAPAARTPRLFVICAPALAQAPNMYMLARPFLPACPLIRRIHPFLPMRSSWRRRRT